MAKRELFNASMDELNQMANSGDTAEYARMIPELSFRKSVGVHCIAHVFGVVVRGKEKGTVRAPYKQWGNLERFANDDETTVADMASLASWSIGAPSNVERRALKIDEDEAPDDAIDAELESLGIDPTPEARAMAAKLLGVSITREPIPEPRKVKKAKAAAATPNEALCSDVDGWEPKSHTKSGRAKSEKELLRDIRGHDSNVAKAAAKKAAKEAEAAAGSEAKPAKKTKRTKKAKAATKKKAAAEARGKGRSLNESDYEFTGEPDDGIDYEPIVAEQIGQLPDSVMEVLRKYES